MHTVMSPTIDRGKWRRFAFSVPGSGPSLGHSVYLAGTNNGSNINQLRPVRLVAKLQIVAELQASFLGASAYNYIHKKQWLRLISSAFEDSVTDSAGIVLRSTDRWSKFEPARQSR